MKTSLQAMRREALIRVRDQYELSAGWDAVRLEDINRVRPPSRRYCSTDEIVRQWLTAAEAVANFAVHVGLLTPEEVVQVARDFAAAHPEMLDDDSGGAN